MASHDYSRSVTGVLTDESNGEEFPHAFVYAGRDCWADGKAVETGWASVAPPGKPALMLRLAVKAGVVTGARKGKEGETVEAHGKAVSPDPEQIGAAPGPVVAATVEWEGKRWGVDELAVRSGAVRFPDGRTVALRATPDGRARALLVLQDEPQETPRGIAWIHEGEEVLYTQSAALAIAPSAQGAALAAMPVRPERDLRSLFSKDPDALTSEKLDAPVVNLPIRFWAISAENKSGDKIRPPLLGIILFRFEVAEDFGAKNNRKKGEDEDARAAYIVLTTTDGVLVIDRDHDEPYEAPAGTLVWVDEKSDLRTLNRFVPRWAGEPLKLMRCTEVLLTPKKLAKFELPNGEPGLAWRIELKIKGHVVHPATLVRIAALVDQLPDLPIRQARTIEAQAESWG